MGREKDMEEKRHRIIGTAGHIDHGKTWMVKALTGTDTDRLAEEKRRGITIENGFAFLKFPDGREAGIIDVPGHERFIKNMLAGAGGIDIAMVVIAVDEGVMPQTREHRKNINDQNRNNRNQCACHCQVVLILVLAGQRAQ